jgi:hypothetical protein
MLFFFVLLVVRRPAKMRVMPIRFRCAYCNQLLGIARRKAGTVVRCPTCAGKVVVPNVELEDTEFPGREEPMAFERDDFESFLNPPARENGGGRKKDGPAPFVEAQVAIPAVAAPPGAWGTYAEPPFDVEKIHPTAPSEQSGKQRPGDMVISRKRLLIVAALAVLALALVFGAGILLGYFLFATAHS